MIRSIRFYIFFFIGLAVAGSAMGQTASDYRLHFKEGDLHRVVISEVLRLAMHFPQVDEHDARPSIRTSTYSFTEHVDSLLPDGSAIIAASLDSFTTGINFGEGPNAENFFRFNSADDWSISHELHDIKVLPRAQFLGHMLHFIMRPDGTIAQFLDLQNFHDDAVGKGYDYDMVHAMLSLTDSLRMGQLLELGFGGLAAANGPYTSPSTATEIPITRTVRAERVDAKSLRVQAKYIDPPQRVEYLEGIATPLGINTFYGGGMGELTLDHGFLKHSKYEDTAKVLLQVDIDTVPEQITRTVVTDVYPIKVLRGGTVTLQEIKVHTGVPRDPTEDQMKDANIIDPATGKITETAKPKTPQQHDESTSSQH